MSLCIWDTIFSTVFHLNKSYRFQSIFWQIVVLIILAIMLVTHSAIKAAVEKAAEATENLTYTKDGKHFSKVCCICDRLIRHGKETAVKLSDLKTLSYRFSKAKVGSHAPVSAKDHYTVQCYDTTLRKYRFLRAMVLSRRSYATKVTQYDALGCCCECSGAVKAMKCNPTKLPCYAICNGLVIGKTPACLAELNEVELALISPARINKHVFSFTAGTHKSIQGWHSMYYNDLENFNGVANYINANTTRGDSASVENSDDEDDEVSDNSDDEVEEEATVPGEGLFGSGRKFPVVAVVLSGPFTPRQKALTYTRTKVRWFLITRAIRWLKKHNKLFLEFELPERKVIQPILVDKRYVLVQYSTKLPTKCACGTFFRRTCRR
jgi:hypothetical protein